ncbi:MAG: hypothetical protein B6U68_02970 [Candidatus Aenigmarchaeota archaeon ex4484_14]|nr:MAG: hypothetical protein B6U68_02970 [Candidatus Aenigmarchaeota archaeon ex4484_14]
MAKKLLLQSALKGRSSSRFDFLALSYEKFFSEFSSYFILGKTVPFACINQFCSWRFCFCKSETRLLLYEWRRRGFIQIVNFHGIKLLKQPADKTIGGGRDG